MAGLEGADETITLQRAAELAGLTLHTLSDAARAGRLRATRPGHDWLTTRRDLHQYLRGRSHGVIKPLPPNYQTPQGEEPIATGRPGRTPSGRSTKSLEVDGIQSPMRGEEAARLAKALRAFPDLAPALSKRDIAALEVAAEILERITEVDRE